jgi:hypothetical protein
MSAARVCPSCQQRWEVPEHLAGRSANCPRCGAVMPPPRPAQETTSAAPPPAEVEDVEVVEDEAEEVLEVVEAVAPRPRRDLDKLPRLLRARKFLIQAGSGSEYVILDAESDRELAIAVEEGGGGEGLLRALGSSGGMRGARVNVSDARTDEELFAVERSPFQRFVGQSLLQVEMFDPAEECLGSFETKMFPAKGTFWIYDGRDREVAELEGQWGGRPDYRYWDRKGNRLGRLKSEGERRWLFTSPFGWCKAGGSLLLTLSEDLADRPEDKILLLATTLILEIGLASMRMNMGPMR